MAAGGSPALSLHVLPLATVMMALAAAVPKPQAVANPSNTGSISCKACSVVWVCTFAFQFLLNSNYWYCCRNNDSGSSAPSLYGIFPYTGLKFYFYEKMKIQVPEEHRKDIIAKLGCGSVSGLLGQIVTYPLNVIRQKMQVQTFSRSNLENGKGTFGSLVVIVKHQGFANLGKYIELWTVSRPSKD
ncbi:hypothetical protein GUJ93_ZPchr0014g46875 [Zizania palustris]|uniref:Uncharacterized protein n=1 Tax=Zizania palustris TaxID=103762 RepID=A0A8J5VV04_ZIZPA|nr:hypothetical protein GUJ93_ZPchr0014g46875 [Zizania palustris]